MRLVQTRRSLIVWLLILFAVFLFVGPLLASGQLRSAVASSTNASSHSSTSVQAAPVDGSPLTYHGGPVQHIQYVYAIFWLPVGQHYELVGNDSKFESLISRYFNDVSGSNITRLMIEYPDDINASPSANVVYGGGFVDTTPYPHPGTTTAPILGNDVVNEIQKIVNSGALPTGVDDSYYVFTANGLNVCEDSALTLCTFATSQQPAGFCAYHSSVDTSPYALISVNPNGIAGGCQISISGVVSYPNNDVIADSAISLVSQEQLNMQSDPYSNSWYDTSSTTEVSNKCAGQYGNVNLTSGYNIIMNGHQYILQQEWSNDAGGCTLTPPVTATIQVTLTPYAHSNALSPTNYFPLTYAIGKQLFVVQYSTFSVTINADPNTSLTIGPMSSNSNNGLERWCLDSACSGLVMSLGTGVSSISPSYYDLVEQNVYEATSDNSQPTTFAVITYQTAPVKPLLPPVMNSVNLASFSQYIWVLRGSTASVSKQSYPANPTTQLWINPAASWNVSQPYQIPLVISYHQYAMSFGFSVIPPTGATLTGPTVSFTNNGQPNTTIAGSKVWADAGSSYSYGTSLGSSTNSERWVSIAGSGTGKVTGAASVSNAYYNQFAVTVNYKLNGPASSSPPKFTAYSFGANLTVPLSSSSNLFWLDANSTYSIMNLLPGSNSTERWVSTQTGIGMITGPQTLDFTYYHQYSLNFSFSIVGGGSPSTLPVVNYSSFNSTSSLKLSSSPSPVWVNAGSTLNASAAMISTNSTERWAYSSGSQVASMPGTYEIKLYHQFQVGFSVQLNGGTPSTMPVTNAFSFGHGISITPSPVAASNSTNSSAPFKYYWLDAGSSYSLPASLGSGSSERFLTLSNSTGVISAPQTVVVKYYNQYIITLGYSVINGANPSGGPFATISLFGRPVSVVVNQTSGQVWADGGSTVSLPSQLPGSTNNERWSTNSTVSGLVAPSLSITPTYDHQFMVNLVANPSGAPVVLSEQSGWYDSGSTLTVSAIAGRGWAFEGWLGQGVGTYTGNFSQLFLTVTTPITETANFYTALSISAPSTGSVTYSFGNVTGTIRGGATKTVYVPPGQPLSMFATPFPVFYAFSSWSGNLTGGPNASSIVQNPYTFSVNAPTALNVAFKINLLGIIIVVVVVIVAVASVFMLRLRNRPQQEEYSEEYSEGETLEATEGSAEGP